MANFTITDPQANQLLIYDEVTKTFINSDIVSNTGTISKGLNLGNGSNLFINAVGDTLRFRSLTGSNEITVSENGNSIGINFSGIASKLGKSSEDDLLKKLNNLSDVDPIEARKNLSVLSSSEMDTRYLRTNASNMPDIDNTYELGRNGRRFASVYAVKFFGLINEAIEAQNLKRNGATDGDALVWNDENDCWIPKTIEAKSVSSLSDVDVTRITDGSVLVYKQATRRWVATGLTSGTGGSSSMAGQNIGAGYNIYSTNTGSLLSFRSISAGKGVNVSYNFNNEEVVISADIPDNTDDLPEGNINLYFTNTRFDSRLKSSKLNSLSDVSNGSPATGNTIVWDGTQWSYRPTSTNIRTTDDITEGTSNFFQSASRTNQYITQYMIDNPLSLSGLSDIGLSSLSRDQYLVYDGTKWKNSSISINTLSGFDLGSIVSGNTLVWDGSKFRPGTMPTKLSDLEEDNTASYFNNTIFTRLFNSGVSRLDTSDIKETDSRKYLYNDSFNSFFNNASVLSLRDVSGSFSSGDLMSWNGTAFIAKSASSIVSDNLTLKLSDMSDVSLGNITDGQLLIWNSTNRNFESGNFRYSTLNSLTDVSITTPDINSSLIYRNGHYEQGFFPVYAPNGTPSNGDILTYNNNVYSNSNPSSLLRNIKLGDLQNVTIPSPINNEVLVYNGTLNSFEAKPIHSIVESTTLSGHKYIEDIDGTIREFQKLSYDVGTTRSITLTYTLDSTINSINNINATLVSDNDEGYIIVGGPVRGSNSDNIEVVTISVKVIFPLESYTGGEVHLSVTGIYDETL